MVTNLKKNKPTAIPNTLIKVEREIDAPKEYQSYLKGFVDLFANINSKESSALKKKISMMDADDIDKFFEKLGFEVIEKSELPQKIWGDCIKCAKFPECDEIALSLSL